MFRHVSSAIGRAIARYLSQPVAHYRPLTTSPASLLESTLRPGDVLLVEGNTRVSSAIKYLTQSTWSHSALYVGVVPDILEEGGEAPVLIEVDIVQGVIAVPLAKYSAFHTRVCRPAALSGDDAMRVVEYAISRLGHTYDMKNLIDLARYLLPTPPVPMRWRRRMMALGSGDPTKSICSTLIAQAFQSVGYPILPDMIRRRDDPGADDHNREILTIRHYSLYAPRDFDISPYFEIVKPAIEHGVTYRSAETKPASPASGVGSNLPVTRSAAGGETNLSPRFTTR